MGECGFLGFWVFGVEGLKRWLEDEGAERMKTTCGAGFRGGGRRTARRGEESDSAYRE